MAVEVQSTQVHSERVDIQVADKLQAVAPVLLRYSLVLVIGWVGALKFTAYESEAVQAFVTTSPLMSWLNSVLSVRGVGALLGVVELTTALLIALRPLSAKAGAVGAAMAVVMFLTTLSFLLSTPGVWEPSLGFPALSGKPGQFLAKDVVLLATAVWLLAEALQCVIRERNRA